MDISAFSYDFFHCIERSEFSLTSIIAVAQSLRSQGQTRVHFHTQHVSRRPFVLASLLSLSVSNQHLAHWAFIMEKFGFKVFCCLRSSLRWLFLSVSSLLMPLRLSPRVLYRWAHLHTFTKWWWGLHTSSLFCFFRVHLSGPALLVLTQWLNKH